MRSVRLPTALLAVWAVFWTAVSPAAISLERVVLPLAPAAAELQRRLADAPLDDDALLAPDWVGRFYAARGFRPAWVNEFGPLPAAAALIAVLTEAEREGLRPADYPLAAIGRMLADLAGVDRVSAGQVAELDLLLTDAFLGYGSHLLSGRLDPHRLDPDWGFQARSRDLAEVLEQALASGRTAAALAALRPAAPGYARLRTALAGHRAWQRSGGWPRVSPGPKLEHGVRGPRVQELRARLRATGDLDGPGAAEAGGLLKVAEAAGERGAVRDDALFDAELERAVQRFQRRHGLVSDGIVGSRTLAALNVPVAERIRQIEVNLERWRWLPEDLSPRHILINVPDFTLQVIENGRPVQASRVVVGRSQRPTPLFSAYMSYLVLNPVWHIPRKIAVEDMLPQLRHDPYSLFRQNIHVFDPRNGGHAIDPGHVDWRAVGKGNFHYRLRQEPGPGNALGRIKFMFPNHHSVYLHDTSAPHLFRRQDRAYSSGCIRVSEPFKLAEYLLGDEARWSQETIAAASRRRGERIVPLPEQIPIHLLYWTAWVEEDGSMQFRHDLYRHDERLSRALAPAGTI